MNPSAETVVSLPSGEATHILTPEAGYVAEREEELEGGRKTLNTQEAPRIANFTHPTEIGTDGQPKTFDVIAIAISPEREKRVSACRDSENPERIILVHERVDISEEAKRSGAARYVPFPNRKSQRHALSDAEIEQNTQDTDPLTSHIIELTDEMDIQYGSSRVSSEADFDFGLLINPNDNVTYYASEVNFTISRDREGVGGSDQIIIKDGHTDPETSDTTPNTPGNMTTFTRVAYGQEVEHDAGQAKDEYEQLQPGPTGFEFVEHDRPNEEAEPEVITVIPGVSAMIAEVVGDAVPVDNEVKAREYEDEDAYVASNLLDILASDESELDLPEYLDQEELEGALRYAKSQIATYHQAIRIDKFKQDLEARQREIAGDGSAIRNASDMLNGAYGVSDKFAVLRDKAEDGSFSQVELEATILSDISPALNRVSDYLKDQLSSNSKADGAEDEDVRSQFEQLLQEAEAIEHEDRLKYEDIEDKRQATISYARRAETAGRLDVGSVKIGESYAELGDLTEQMQDRVVGNGHLDWITINGYQEKIDNLQRSLGLAIDNIRFGSSAGLIDSAQYASEAAKTLADSVSKLASQYQSEVS